MKLLPLLVFAMFFGSSVLAEGDVELTSELDGTTITYNYAGGRSYQVSFAESDLRYRYLTGSKPEAWWGPFPYKATVTEKGEYLVGWFEEGYGDYITLLFDPETRVLYGSGIIAGKETHFDRAEIVEVEN